MMEPPSITGGRGRLFVGPPAQVPMRPGLLGGAGPDSDIARMLRDPHALAQLRAQWRRFGLPGDPGQMTERDLRAGLERAVRSGKLAGFYVPNASEVGPDDDEDVSNDRDVELGDRKGPVRDWSEYDKVAEALSRSRNYLQGELRELVEDMVRPANIAIMVGFILALVAAHFATGPAAVALDAAIVGLAYLYAGYAGAMAMIAFFKTSFEVTQATNEAQIDKAAKEYAAHFVALGTAVLSRFIGRAKLRKMKKPRAQTGPAGKAGSAPPATPPKKKQSSPTSAKDARTKAAVDRMPEDFQKEHKAAEAAGWKKPNGDPWYPPNNGAVSDPVKRTLSPGAKMDRYGDERGSFLSKSGDSFESRAINRSPSEPFRTYQVKKPLLVEEAKVAPWFGQPGGGTQYRLIDPVSGKGMSVETAKRLGFLSGGG